jgi:mannitol/fructose-specific phosphotransferase system IIA component (Ntr-type)
MLEWGRPRASFFVAKHGVIVRDSARLRVGPGILNQRGNMDFKSALAGGSFCLDLRSDTKEGIIEEMIDALVAEGKLADKADALRAVMDREGKMSTGVQDGVAIPHGKTPLVDRLVTAFGLKREGMDFSAIDGQPSRIFVMTISSNLRTGPHLQYLSEVCRVLNSAAMRERLLTARTREDVLRIMTEER